MPRFSSCVFFARKLLTLATWRGGYLPAIHSIRGWIHRVLLLRHFHVRFDIRFEFCLCRVHLFFGGFDLWCHFLCNGMILERTISE